MTRSPYTQTTRIVWFGPFIYGICRALARFVYFCCVKLEVFNAPPAENGRGYILACTHISHLEPVCVSVLVRRNIDWIIRREYYQVGFVALFWRAINAFPIRRQGVTAGAIRTAINRAKNGRILGMFPEGGVAVGAASVCRGGPIKRGVCLIASAAQTPIVPVVILGTERLNCVSPWLPFRRARVWIIFGQPIAPPAFLPGPAAARERRRLRAESCDLLRARFMELYQQLRRQYGIEDRDVP